jgi:superoxide dismutase, Fe-Mn family
VVNVLLTDVTPSKAARQQARMVVEAKTTILNSGDSLPATEVAKLAGFSASNLSVEPNMWKRNREIFAIQHGREDYLPLYGLDPGDHCPRKEMAEILKIFGDAKSRKLLRPANQNASPHSILSKSGGEAPSGELAKDIDAHLGSFSKFQEQFSKAAAGVFGSGWARLTLGPDGKFQVESSANQDSPLTSGRTPVLGVDVWEHACYLKYQNRRPEYVAAFFHVLNLDLVSGQYAAAKKAQQA